MFDNWNKPFLSPLFEDILTSRNLKKCYPSRIRKLFKRNFARINMPVTMDVQDAKAANMFAHAG